MDEWRILRRMTGAERRTRLAAARLYLCTSDRADLAELIATVCVAGVDIIQLRDKQLDARPLLDRAGIARAAAHRHDALFVLNDRPDLALACAADGVHVGQDDAPPSLCRQILGDEFLVGLSTHAPDELTAAASEPVDYLSVGPVVPTPTKPGRPGTGLDFVRFATQHADRPFFVTGGVNSSSLPTLIATGASGFVVVRAITEAVDPALVVRELRLLLDETNPAPAAGASLDQGS